MTDIIPRMSVAGLNHVTFSVPDLDAAIVFYVDVLGCVEIARWPTGAYLLAGGVWIALVTHPGYSHVALSAEPGRFAELVAALDAAGAHRWQDNWTEGDSLYFEDPGGNRLELHATTLSARLRSAADAPWDGLRIAGDALSLAARPPRVVDPRKARAFACAPAGAWTVVLDDDDRVLLLRAPGWDFWEVPNGAVEADEAPRDAAVREVQEEAGITVDPIAVVDVRSVRVHDDVPMLMSIGYVARYAGGDIAPGDDMAGSDVMWATLDEIESQSLRVKVPSELGLYRRAAVLAQLATA